VTFELRPAKRRKCPMLMTMYGVSGSGKTFSALLFAAGLAGPNGRVGFLDAENGRGEMYADSPGIMAALPNGYDYMEIKAPFSTVRFSQAIDAAEAAKLDVLVIDSFSHEWEGIGGVRWVAENFKLGKSNNWARAKTEHFGLVGRILAANIDLIFCLRAREKSKPIKGSDKYEFLGLLPITEDNFVYEMGLSLMLEEQTHKAFPIKCPDPLAPLFPSDGSLVTKATGAKVREWSIGGAALQESPADLFDRAAQFAGLGTQPYEEFFRALSPADKTRLKSSADHDINKEIAAKADKQNAGEPETDPRTEQKLLGA
jgi:hypothetical protein